MTKKERPVSINPPPSINPTYRRLGIQPHLPRPPQHQVSGPSNIVYTYRHYDTVPFVGNWPPMQPSNMVLTFPNYSIVPYADDPFAEEN